MIRLKSLLFEVSLDQLKTQFVDTGKISDSEFTEIVDASGGKSAYATWLTKQVAGKIIKPEDLYKYNTYFKIFDRRKREYLFQDINQYKTSDDIAQFISKSVDLADREKADPSQQRGVAKTDRYAEFKIGEVEGFTVYELPKGRKDLYGASCEIGSGTEWCTATGKTRQHFDRYISEGPLFIFIKPGLDKKYQFHYESQSFMDKKDKSVLTNNPSKIVIKLLQFIESKRPQYRIPLKIKLLQLPDTLTNADLQYPGNLNLNDTPIQSLPAGLHINGDLDLNNTPIKSLPAGLRVGGDISLIKAQIQSLPADLYVGGSLYLSDTPIQSLPKDLKVGGTLDITNTSIQSLPADLQINGSLYIGNTKVQSLPAGLRVGGHLNLSYTSIKSLPDGLRVGGNLNFSSTPIQSLPADLQVGNELNLRNTPLSKKYTEDEIQQMIEKSGGGVKGRIIGGK
jgi:hypothetical protein